MLATLAKVFLDQGTSGGDIGKRGFLAPRCPAFMLIILETASLAHHMSRKRVRY
jgi:hypothetical protein